MGGIILLGFVHGFLLSAVYSPPDEGSEEDET